MSENNKLDLYESLERFKSTLTDEDIQHLRSIQERPLPAGIRFNSLKVEPDRAVSALSARYGWQVESVCFCKNAWTIQESRVPPGNTIEHRMGQYYLQDAASMVPVSLFAMDNPHPLILDMAASPGGKTTHLIDRTQDRGLIVANDASRGRIPALRAVLSSWSGTNAIISNFPGEAFGDWYADTFDLVLLDAPCSMENLRPTPSHPLRKTSVDERLRLQGRQVQLLVSGLKALKPGGQLVYATCSLAPEEDEVVIDAAMRAYPGVFDIIDVSQRFSFPTAGLTEFMDKKFAPELKSSLRLWPHLTGMSGFFCALLTKHELMESTPKTPPYREFSRTGMESITGEFQSEIEDRILRDFGFSLGSMLNRHSLEIYQRQDQLFLTPARYLSQFNTLPYEYIGLSLGRWIENKFEPAHEFISRFGHEFTRGMIRINNEQITPWIAGRDIRHPETALTPQGQYLLVTDEADRNLGMGKLLPKRLRNMLPRGSV